MPEPVPTLSAEAPYIVLFHDVRERKAAAATVDDPKPDSTGFATALEFEGRLFAELPHDTLLLWDHLVVPLHPEGSDVVGVCLWLQGDSVVERILKASPLIRNSRNVMDWGGGYFALCLRPNDGRTPETDVASCFGSQVYLCGEDCLVMLHNWPPCRWGFPICSGIVKGRS